MKINMILINMTQEVNQSMKKRWALEYVAQRQLTFLMNADYSRAQSESH